MHSGTPRRQRRTLALTPVVALATACALTLLTGLASAAPSDNPGTVAAAAAWDTDRAAEAYSANPASATASG
ncbi:discoidin domain-containing protein, partial [Streptomyces sp. NPDC059900]